MRVSLRNYQKEAVEFLRRNRGGILAMDTGTGKTRTALTYALGFPGPLLIFCRKDDFLTWRIQLEEFGISRDDMWFIRGSKDVANTEPKHVTLTTWDLLRSPKVFALLRSWSWSCIIGDELHLIKRPKAQRSKRATRVTRNVDCPVVGLTGTFITEGIFDAFNQTLFVDRGRRFGGNWWKFRRKYFVSDAEGFRWFPKKNSKAKITNALGDLVYVIRKDDVLDLPDKRYILKGCDMESRQAKAYREMLHEFEVQLAEAERVEVNMVATQVQKLQQIASGFIYDEEHQVHWLSSSKIDELMTLLEEYEEKVVVWCSFTAEAERIHAACLEAGIPAKVYCGTAKTRKRIRRAFCGRRSKVKVFIANVSMGVGMNELVVSNRVIYFSNSRKLIDRIQSEGRTRRIGSERHDSVTYIDLVTEDTVDHAIYKALRRKENVAEILTEKIRSSHHHRLSEAIQEV
jgi:superfamily II DNA or RNA helicase